MTSPGPCPRPRLAKSLHKPEADVRQSMHDLCLTWGSDRVIAVADGVTVRLTPAAVVAIHQAFGVRNLPGRRTTVKEPAA